MKKISGTSIFCMIALIISTSSVFGKVVFSKDKDIASETELPTNPSKDQLKALSEEVLGELRSLDSSDTSARSFGLFKHKIAALESKLAYLFSKILSPFAPVYIDVGQDPYSSVYYRKEDNHPTTARPSFFSQFFKAPSYNSNSGDDYYYNRRHSISKRSVSAQENVQPEEHGESQGRTLHHIFPAFQDRMNYLMNRVFGPFFPQQHQRPIPFQGHTPNHYKTKLENPLEYQNDFDHGTSSQFHYQSTNSPNSIFPNFLKRFGITSNSDRISIADYLTKIMDRVVQTPVVKQKHAESQY